MQLLRYLSDTKKSSEGLKIAEFIYSNFPTIDPVDQANVLSSMRKLRPQCETDIYQVSLSLPIGDDVSHEKWGAIALDFLAEMGLDPTCRPVVIYKHGDTAHRHIHIATSRIGYDGSLWNDSRDVFRAIEITQQLEIRHGLTITEGLSGRQQARRLTKNEREMSIRTGELAPRAVVQQAIDHILSGDQITTQAFVEQLASVGVTARPNCTKTSFNGFSFECFGVPFKGADLGKKYTLKNLKIRGLKYEQERDLEWLNERKAAGNIENAGIDRGVAGTTAGGAGVDAVHDRASERGNEIAGDARERGGRTDRDSGNGAQKNCFGHPTGHAGRDCRDRAGDRGQDQQVVGEGSQDDQGCAAEKTLLADLRHPSCIAGDTADGFAAMASIGLPHIDFARAERQLQIEQAEGRPLDDARCSYLVCLAMLRHGYTRPEIEEALSLISPTHTDTRGTARFMLDALLALESEQISKHSAIFRGL
ncbi:relaxase/mobilization nuclease domain-containing protein [Aeromonas rivipollensis]|uniref:relaxase/mobilization nuclease domain-containing protein n=1 Tax=Aeromonas rivipollensis TaxID=948519 RepID=UPI002978AE4A|nr:relaxase/mobilization nuclease domain-containing protein [Aeromonas rivipollensis]